MTGSSMQAPGYLKGPFLAALLLISGQAFAEPAITSTQNLTSLLSSLTEKLVGVIGIAAQQAGSPVTVLVNGDEPFPMASTYKVPIAITLLRRVDRGELSLSQLVSVEDDGVVFSQIIASAFPHGGASLSLANLIEVMITYSDNTATDLCLALAGGPAAVTATMRELGIEGMRIDRSTAAILKDFYDIEAGRDGLAEVIATARRDPQRVDAPRADFEADERDQSTPQAMLSLLIALRAGNTMSTASTDFLLGAMSRTVTKPDRLGLLLPRNTKIRHKTGTVGGVANDVGFISLPNGGEFTIVVFSKSSNTPPADRERAVAEVARTLYDFFALQADAGQN